MAETTKHVLNSDIKTLFTILKTIKTLAFVYAFILAFLSFTLLLAFSSPNASSPSSSNSTSHSSNTSTKTFKVTPYGNKTQASVPTTNTASSHVSHEAKSQKNTNQAANMKQEIRMMESLRKCDFFVGQWVKDDQYYPLYQPGSCNLIDEQFDCINNERPNKDFQKLKWRPNGCSLPRLENFVQILQLICFVL
ncbi:hypothetical protein KIW84_062587 [Lathyrus oleraceus]|uniref:Trichome birefringence-like N-terminal domain-containing protein n=1 Tax=Pisum sativum TaxID=3888 RepID=A0A9D5A3R2_PEA|nr:hypothetical protein KIW84_062587 [Pisum sativum]